MTWFLLSVWTLWWTLDYKTPSLTPKLYKLFPMRKKRHAHFHATSAATSLQLLGICLTISIAFMKNQDFRAHYVKSHLLRKVSWKNTLALITALSRWGKFYRQFLNQSNLMRSAYSLTWNLFQVSQFELMYYQLTWFQAQSK